LKVFWTFSPFPPFSPAARSFSLGPADGWVFTFQCTCGIALFPNLWRGLFSVFLNFFQEISKIDFLAVFT